MTSSVSSSQTWGSPDLEAERLLDPGISGLWIELSELAGHQIPARRRPVGCHPLGDRSAHVLDCLLDLLFSGLGLELWELEFLETAELYFRSNFDRGDEGQGLTRLKVDFIDARRQQWIQLALGFGLLPVARQEPLDDILLDLLLELLLDQLRRHLSLAETRQLGVLPILLHNTPRLGFDRGRRHFDLELFPAGPDVLDR